MKFKPLWKLTATVLILISHQTPVFSECGFTRDSGGQEGFTNDAGICIDRVHQQVFSLRVLCLDHNFNQVIWEGMPQPGDFIDTLGCNAIRVRPYTRRRQPSEELFKGCAVTYSPVMLGDGHRSRQGPRSEHQNWDFSLVHHRHRFCRQPADARGYRIQPQRSREGNRDPGDDERFVRALYRNILDREPDSGGIRHWLNLLEQGKSRQWVLVQFFASQEYASRHKNNREFVRDLYQATRFREPTNSEMSAALKVLAQGNARETLLTKMLQGKTASTNDQGASASRDYRNSGTHLTCKKKHNKEGKCCCFTGSHTYLFANGRVDKVIARFDTGKKFDCRSTVTFDVHREGRWVSVGTFDAVSSRGGSTEAPNKVSVSVNRAIDGFRLGDGCACCIDDSEIWLY